MPARRSLALLLICLVPLVASCSDNTKDTATGGSTTTTTAAAPASSNSDTTVTTAPKVAFAEGVKQMNQKLDAAKGDVCALVSSLGTINVADPATPEEAKQAVTVVARYLNAIADAAPAQAAALHKAASDFEAESAAANYDVTKLSESKVMSSTEVGTALTNATAKCTGAG